jgi:hypothetical protein
MTICVWILRRGRAELFGVFTSRLNALEAATGLRAWYDEKVFVARTDGGRCGAIRGDT